MTSGKLTAGQLVIYGSGDCEQVMTVKRVNKNKTVRVSFWGKGRNSDVLFFTTVKQCDLRPSVHSA